MLKKMKRSKLLVLILCLTLFFIPMTTMAKGYDYGPDIYVDGYYLYTDVSPIVVNGRTLVPLRAISEALGCNVQWFPSVQGVDICTPGDELSMSMYVGDYYADVYYGYGYEYVYMDAAATLYNGRVMVPLRFIAETLGLDVYYDSYYNEIYINSSSYY